VTRPVAGSAHTFDIHLFSQSTGQLLASPTLAEGDVLVSTDGGALQPINTLPTATAGIVTVDLDIDEVGQDRFTVHFVDAAGDEWKPVYYSDQLDIANDQTTLSNKIDAIFTTVITESYAGTGEEFTPAQALYEICQVLSEFSIDGKVLSVFKRNRQDIAAKYDLNSETKATSRTRSQ
jgi:hypothetical protein